MAGWMLDTGYLMLNGVALHPSAPKSNDDIKSYCQIFLTNLFNRTMLHTMTELSTKPENLINTALKTRSGGKAGYKAMVYPLSWTAFALI
jgi:hypothetical protein